MVCMDMAHACRILPLLFVAAFASACTETATEVSFDCRSGGLLSRRYEARSILDDAAGSIAMAGSPPAARGSAWLHVVRSIPNTRSRQQDLPYGEAGRYERLANDSKRVVHFSWQRQSSVVVCPANAITLAGRTVQLHGVAFDSLQQPIPDARFVWRSADSGIATVDLDGKVTGRRSGKTTVTASVEADTARATITVVELVGHRGLACCFPENTIAAITGGFDLGVTAVEVDVRPTADGVPVLMHDPTVDRTTNGTGHVSKLSYDQVRSLDACTRFNNTWARSPCPVPTVAEALDAAHGRGRLILELKDEFPVSVIKRVLAEIYQRSMQQDVMITSFVLRTVRNVAALDSTIALGLVAYDLKDLDQIRHLNRPMLLLPQAEVFTNPDYIHIARAKGVEVGTWFITNPFQASRLVAADVHWMLSDIPIASAIEHLSSCRDFSCAQLRHH